MYKLMSALAISSSHPTYDLHTNRGPHPTIQTIIHTDQLFRNVPLPQSTNPQLGSPPILGPTVPNVSKTLTVGEPGLTSVHRPATPSVPDDICSDQTGRLGQATHLPSSRAQIQSAPPTVPPSSSSSAHTCLLTTAAGHGIPQPVASWPPPTFLATNPLPIHPSTTHPLSADRITSPLLPQADQLQCILAGLQALGFLPPNHLAHIPLIPPTLVAPVGPVQANHPQPHITLQPSAPTCPTGVCANAPATHELLLLGHNTPFSPTSFPLQTYYPQPLTNPQLVPNSQSTATAPLHPIQTHSLNPNSLQPQLPTPNPTRTASPTLISPSQLVHPSTPHSTTPSCPPPVCTNSPLKTPTISTPPSTTLQTYNSTPISPTSFPLNHPPLNYRLALTGASNQSDALSIRRSNSDPHFSHFKDLSPPPLLPAVRPHPQTNPPTAISTPPSSAWSNPLSTVASIFPSGSIQLPLTLPTPSWLNGKPKIDITPEVEQKGLAALSFAAIGRFDGQRPTIEWVEARLKSSWKLLGPCHVSLLSKGQFLFRFSSEADRGKALQSSPSLMDRRKLRIRAWHQGVDLGSHPTSIPVWLRIKGLQPEHWCTDIIFAIANIIGRPLKLDGHTVRQRLMTFARVCVDLDPAKPRPDQVEIAFASGRTATVDLEYENPPCSLCARRGHPASRCARQLEEGHAVKLSSQAPKSHPPPPPSIHATPAKSTSGQASSSRHQATQSSPTSPSTSHQASPSILGLPPGKSPHSSDGLNPSLNIFLQNHSHKSNTSSYSDCDEVSFVPSTFNTSQPPSPTEDSIPLGNMFAHLSPSDTPDPLMADTSTPKYQLSEDVSSKVDEYISEHTGLDGSELVGAATNASITIHLPCIVNAAASSLISTSSSDSNATAIPTPLDSNSKDSSEDYTPHFGKISTNARTKKRAEPSSSGPVTRNKANLQPKLVIND